MKIFISGAAGFIGSTLCSFALKKGHHVVFYDIYIPSNVSFSNILNHENTTIIKGNLNNISGLSEILKRCDYVVHLAGISDGIQGKNDPDKTREINIEYTKAFIELCQETGIKRFLFASTMGVYGNSYNEILHEDLDLKPEDPYSQSKAFIEQFLIEKNKTDFSTCSLRIAMVYGTSITQKSNLLVNQLVKIAKEKKQLNIFGGLQQRPQIHVNDVVRIFIELLEINVELISGKAYNIVESNPTLKEITSIIKTLIPELEINFLEQRDNENSFNMSGEKIKNELNIYPSIKLVEGIRELIID